MRTAKPCVSRCLRVDRGPAVPYRMTGKRVLAFTAAALLAAGAALANEEAADSTNANQLWTGGGLGLNLTGAGVTVGVWEAFEGGDWEVRDTHEVFTFGQGGGTRVTYGDTPQAGTTAASFSDHATHVAGTIGAAHIPGNQSRWGMAPGVNIISYSVSDDTNEMRTASNPALSNTVDISNHSYGIKHAPWQAVNVTFTSGSSSTTLAYDAWALDWDLFSEAPQYGRYDSQARELDLMLNERPKLLSFYSAGNSRNDTDDRYTDRQNDGLYVTSFSQNFIDNNGVTGTNLGGRNYLVSINDYAPPGYDAGGYDSINGDKAAKNNVVIGATLDFLTDPHANGAGTINTTSFSSYGPTDDGGLGVDLVANGNSLDSAGEENDTDYVRKSGTSMSAPNAAGTAALLLEHWRDENGGTTPDSATQKGLLMHTATDATAFGVGPDYATGYGMINAAEAATHITEAIETPVTTRERHIIVDTLGNLDTHSIDLVATGGDFKASLSWLDLAGIATTALDDRTSKLVNDLDVWVEDEFNNIYFPWSLDPTNPGNAAVRTGQNDVDNFTQVYIDLLTAGTQFTLYVDHQGLLTGGSQDYALFFSGATIASNVIPSPTALSVLPMLVFGWGLRRRRRK